MELVMNTVHCISIYLYIASTCTLFAANNNIVHQLMKPFV